MTQDTEDVVARMTRFAETLSVNRHYMTGQTCMEVQNDLRALLADRQSLSDRIDVTELDANGEAMMCEGCGTTKTLAAILAKHGPQSIACCPERKMVEARYFWNRAALHQEGIATTVGR